MTPLDEYESIVVAIIKEQEAVIGPIAIDQARLVPGLNIDWDKKEAVLSQDPKQTIDRLVEQYKSLFGMISVEVCKEAVGRLAQHLSADQMPLSLR